MEFNLAEIRKKENKTQQELADIVLVKRQTITAIENGGRPSPDFAQRIASALNFCKYGITWTVFFEKPNIS